MSRTVRVEVGITLANSSTLSDVLALIRTRASACAGTRNVIIESLPTYRRALRTPATTPVTWQLVPSPAPLSAARTESQQAQVSKSFRLLSPSLRNNEQDCGQCAEFLKLFTGDLVGVELNAITGLRVHVDATGLPFEGVRTVCQNFVKYEAAIDSLLPSSRRTGGTTSDRYFKSNTNALGLATKKKRNDAIAACETMEHLINLINPQGSNYKLNIRNLTAELYPSIEFRSHSTTSNPTKILSWIGVCLALVATASARPPVALKETRQLEEEVDAMFQHVVKTDSLREYYQERRVELAASETGKAKGRTGLRKECGCCFRSFAASTALCPCQARKHWFCQECVRKHAETQLFSNLSSKMQCLSTDGCNSHLNTIHLKRALPKKVSDKLVEVQFLGSVERNKKVTSDCPKCTKSKVIVPKGETSMTCPLASCRHEWCRLCNDTPHAPLTCSEAARQKVTNSARISIEESMAHAYVRHCPQCQVAFVRESGCNKMTCPNRGCGILSCYICRQVIQGTDHFNDARCPLYTPRQDMTDRRSVEQAGTATASRFRTKIGRNELNGMVQNLI